ncbi:LysR family transcriptional regulator [Neoaquamicrobium sediminum]|uniref:LysR family transcriptional regulator n=1 Tax=Neoaquamicrobium sediminum TaxID=1849104 RepID=UPI00156446BC|nr:LysR family transcriptional regulator [Mesorhizobium sediminum]NRC53047.1 LysR family transcriptional regulator [Mesorhizobium sediminum]
MELRQLRHFVAVAEELHFGRAAERLGITQPPLSQSIQALEAELGLSLFFRTKRSVRLSPVGQEWLPYARRILDEAAVLPDLARRLSRGEVGTVRLAFVSFVSYSFLPPLVRRFKQSFPEVELVMSEATSDVQIEALLGGELDAGLIIPPPNRAVPVPLGYVPVVSEELVVAVPSAWIEAGQIAPVGGAVSFDHLRDKPLILFPRQGAPALHDVVTRYYADQGARPFIAQHAMQMQTIVNLVAEGMGIAFVPGCMRSLAPPGVTYLKLGGTAPVTEVGVAWRPDSASEALRQLVDMATSAREGPLRNDAARAN